MDYQSYGWSLEPVIHLGLFFRFIHLLASKLAPIACFVIIVKAHIGKSIQEWTK